MKHSTSHSATPAGMEQSRLFASLVRAEKCTESSPVMYVVSVREVSLSGDEVYRHWITRHRYSDFHKLHVELRRLGFPCPRIPPRTWPLTTKSDVFIDQRKEGLDLWLQSCLCILQSLKTDGINQFDADKVKTLVANFLIENLKEKISAHIERRMRRLQQLKIGKAINITPLGNNSQEDNQEFITYSVVGNEVAHNFSPHTATVSFNGDEGETTPCSVCSIPPTPTSQGEFFRSWSLHTTNSLRLCADILKSEMSEPTIHCLNKKKSKQQKRAKEHIPFDLQDDQSFHSDGDSNNNAIGMKNSNREELFHSPSRPQSRPRPEEYSSTDALAMMKGNKPESLHSGNDGFDYDCRSSRTKKTSALGGSRESIGPQKSNRNPIVNIIDCRIIDGKVKFRVRWADTWESADSLLHYMSSRRLRKQAQNLNGLARSVCNDLDI